jgi:hypothetical protein
MSPTPTLFLVGAPKCGTTAMTRYLGQHPGLFMAEKDLHHFGSDLDLRGKPRPTRAAWRAAFAGARAGQVVAESGVWYLHSRRAAAEIAAAVPEARILILLRDPVEAAYAHWAQLRLNAYGHEDLDDFAAALAAEPDRAAGRRLPPGMPMPSALLYRRVFSFADPVQRYLDAFGGERVRVVLQEDLAADTRGEVAGVLRWLELDDEAPLELAPVNTAKVVRSERARRLLRLVPEPWKAALPGDLRRAIRRRVRHANTAHRPRPPLDPAVRAALQADLRPDVVRLEAILGRPLLAPAGPWFAPRPRALP